MLNRATQPSTLLDAQAFGAILLELSDLGPPSEIRLRTPDLAVRLLDFDRVLLSSVTAGTLTAESVAESRAAGGSTLLDRLHTEVVPLAYPLVEGEVVRRRRAQVVRSAPQDPRRYAFAAVLHWSEYVVSPILVDGQVVGLLHADRTASGRGLSDEHAATLQTFAACFALVYERAALRDRLRVQRAAMRRVARWAEARGSDLGTSVLTITGESAVAEGPSAQTPTEQPLRDLLTRREIDVLRYIVRGDTNAGIARALVLSEGTVKFHVKNLLRKLGASNRAEATSRYLRMTADDRVLRDSL